MLLKVIWNGVSFSGLVVDMFVGAHIVLTLFGGVLGKHVWCILVV